MDNQHLFARLVRRGRRRAFYEDASVVKIGDDLQVAEMTDAAALSDDEVQISDQLVQARIATQALTGFPGEPPATLATAYRVQTRSIEKWDDEIAGWKVGGVPPAWREKLGEDWLVGPIYKRSVRHAKGTETVEMPVFADGFAAIEPEFIIELGVTRDQDRLFLGAEIASSPVPAINDYGPTAVVCDFGNNNGLLIGKQITGWQDIPGPIEVKTWINGELIGTRKLEDMTQSALSARDFCLTLSQSLGRELKPGTMISTGAITGVHEAAIGAQSTIEFDTLGSLQLELTRLFPRDAQKANNEMSKGD